MKNRIIILATVATTLLLFSSFLITSCKKESNQIKVEKPDYKSLASFSGTVEVSTEGFLIFSSYDDAELFNEYLASSTHSEVASYFSTIGFTSYAESEGLYEETPNDLVADGEQIDFALDANRMIQIGNFIMKPVENDEYILVMTSSNNNSTSYDDMVEGTFNSTYMNKFATNGPINANDDDMETFMASTPTGHEETTPHSPPTVGARFWGRTKHCTEVNNGAGGYLYDWCCYRQYAFWVKVWSGGCHEEINHPDS